MSRRYIPFIEAGSLLPSIAANFSNFQNKNSYFTRCLNQLYLGMVILVINHSNRGLFRDRYTQYTICKALFRIYDIIHLHNGRANHSWPYYCNYHFYNLSKMTNLTVRLLLDYNYDVTRKFSINGTKYFQMNPLFSHF